MTVAAKINIITALLVTAGVVGLLFKVSYDFPKDVKSADLKGKTYCGKFSIYVSILTSPTTNCKSMLIEVFLCTFPRTTKTLIDRYGIKIFYYFL